jgi:hypothetical protein
MAAGLVELRVGELARSAVARQEAQRRARAPRAGRVPVDRLVREVQAAAVRQPIERTRGLLPREVGTPS